MAAAIFYRPVLAMPGQHLHQSPAGFNRVGVTGEADRHPFQQIHPPLPGFDAAHHVERPLQTGRQSPLREFGSALVSRRIVEKF